MTYLDEADIRRGRETARRIWGNQASILVGDYLYSQAMALIASFHNHGINEVLADACRKMAEGEVLQLCANSQPDLEEAAYLKIVEYKTATLVAAACKVGGIIGGATLEEQALLYRYGMHLGMAFQLADDRLDYSADRERLGKSLGQDLRQGMITLPLLHLLQTCSPSDQRWLKDKIRSQAIEEQDLQKHSRPDEHPRVTRPMRLSERVSTLKPQLWNWNIFRIARPNNRWPSFLVTWSDEISSLSNFPSSLFRSIFACLPIPGIGTLHSSTSGAGKSMRPSAPIPRRMLR